MKTDVKPADVNFTRASGELICQSCGELYFRHQLDKSENALDYNGHPFLRVLCDGRRVKL